MSKKYPLRIDERWIRHDWRMWIRPDIARWMKPGVDPADVIPALARERAQKVAAIERARAAEDAELAAFIARERRVLATLREDMKELKAEMARWRRRPRKKKRSTARPSCACRRAAARRAVDGSERGPRHRCKPEPGHRSGDSHEPRAADGRSRHRRRQRVE